MSRKLVKVVVPVMGCIVVGLLLAEGFGRALVDNGGAGIYRADMRPEKETDA